MSSMNKNRALRADNLTARRAEELQVIVVMNQTFNSAVFSWRFVESFLWLLVEAFELMICSVTLVNVFTLIAQVKVTRNAGRRRLESQNEA